MKSTILQYYSIDQTRRGGKTVKTIMVRGLKEHPVPIMGIAADLEGDEVEIIVSYLNQLSLTMEKWKLMVQELLKASLSSMALARIQEDAARMLCYASLEEFISEQFKRGGSENGSTSGSPVAADGGADTTGEDKQISVPANDNEERKD